jgi:glycine betaine/proline transport system permease protein
LDGRSAATRFLSSNPGLLDGWLKGVVAVDGEPGLTAVRKNLEASALHQLTDGIDIANQWVVVHKLPLGQWMNDLVQFAMHHAQGFFDLISTALSRMITVLTGALLRVPALILVAVLTVCVFALRRSVGLTVFAFGALLLIDNLGLWQSTVETLSLVVLSTVVCMVFGVPIGIAAAHRPWLFRVLHPILDWMQTIPTFVYLIPTLVLFGLGVVPGVISTVIFAIPAPIRLTHLGISSVPIHLREVALAFGATRRQLLFKVELPHALPTIMAGVTQCIMLSLSMVVIAALVGADGLGKPVVRALNSVNIAMGFEAGLAIVILAVILDRVFERPDKPESGGP